MAAFFWVGGTGTWDGLSLLNWSSTSGGTPDKLAVPGASDTVTFDASSGGGTVTVNTDFSVNSLTCGAFTGTLDFSANNNSPTMQTFTTDGTGVRTLNMGSGTWTITGNAATIWSSSVSTNLTITGAPIVNCTYSGSVGTRVFNFCFTTGAGLTFGGTLNFTAGTDIVQILAGGTYTNLDFTGFTGTLTSGVGTTLSLLGNVTLGTGMTVTPDTRAYSMIPTSGTKTFTTNGVAFKRPFTVNATAGAGVILAGALDISAASTPTFTLTQGTFDANNFNVTCGTFSSNNSNTRVLTMGSGTWTITGNNTTVWATGTVTGLTLTGNGTIIFSYSGSVGTRTFSSGTLTYNTIKVTAGTDTFSNLSGGIALTGSLDFTGFSGTWAQTSSLNIKGNLTFGAGSTCSASTGTITLSGTTGTQTITSNAVTYGGAITLAGAGGTFLLADSLTLSATRTLTLTNGTFNANNFNVTCGLFSSANANIRTLTMGSGTWTLTGTGTVWGTSTVTNLTLNPNSSTIVINDASASSKTFSGGTTPFNNLRLSGGGSGTFILGTAIRTMAFNNIAIDTPPHTVQVFAGSTIIALSLTWSGTAANLNTFTSTTGGTAWNVSVASGNVVQDFLSLQDSSAAGGATFYAGYHSTNVSGNTGWRFRGQPGAEFLLKLIDTCI